MKKIETKNLKINKIVMDIFDLKSDQEKAFKRLKKALNDCRKEGIFFVNRYGNLHAYDKSLIDGFGDSSMYADSENEVAVLETQGDVNYLKIANEWCDDDGLHYYGLTKKGFNLYNKTK